MKGMILLTAALLAVPGVGAAEKADANVLMIAVTRVAAPDKLPGECRVSGIVTAVIEGGAFHAGQAVSLGVPCMGARRTLDREPARPSPYPMPLIADALKTSKSGCVRVDGAGKVIWTHAKEAVPVCGQVSGYKITAHVWPLRVKPV